MIIKGSLAWSADPEKVREESEQKAKERVDADPTWQSMEALAEKQVRDGEAHFTKVERFREDYKKDRFAAWYPSSEKVDPPNSFAFVAPGPMGRPSEPSWAGG